MSIRLTPISQTLTARPVSFSRDTRREDVWRQLDMDLSQPELPRKATGLGLTDWVFSPIRSTNLYRKLRHHPAVGEPFEVRVQWYKALENRLSPEGRRYLKQQLLSGRLTDIRADNQRSTLAQLRSLCNTRADGFDGSLILEETLRLLSEPKTVTQKFGVLSDATIQKMLRYYEHLGRQSGVAIQTPVDLNQLRYTFSSTCPAASLMYDMLDKRPSEFVRQVAELTSPGLGFWKTVGAAHISPDEPGKAPEKLREFGIQATPVHGRPGAMPAPVFQIKVPLPYTGMLRALNQQGRQDRNIRGVVESAYQDALIKLVEPEYDPGMGMLLKKEGSLAAFEGLIDAQTSMLQSIVKADGGETSVPFQFILSGRDNEPYLVGYYQPFEATQNALLEALDPNGRYNTNILVGIVSTDEAGSSGRLNMKHEFTLTRAYTKNGELWFKVADSDDNKPELEDWPARKLIPMIHHAVLPAPLAKRLLARINAQPENQYLLPDQTDARNFRLISTVPADRQQTFIADFEKRTQAEAAKQAPQARPTAPAAPSAPTTTFHPAWYATGMPGVTLSQQAFVPPYFPMRPIYTPVSPWLVTDYYARWRQAMQQAATSPYYSMAA